MHHVKPQLMTAVHVTNRVTPGCECNPARRQAALTQCQTLMRQGKLQGGVDALEAIVTEENINPRSEIGAAAQVESR
jgi:hypothetical protein